MVEKGAQRASFLEDSRGYGTAAPHIPQQFVFVLDASGDCTTSYSVLAQHDDVETEGKPVSPLSCCYNPLSLSHTSSLCFGFCLLRFAECDSCIVSSRCYVSTYLDWAVSAANWLSQNSMQTRLSIQFVLHFYKIYLPFSPLFIHGTTSLSTDFLCLCLAFVYLFFRVHIFIHTFAYLFACLIDAVPCFWIVICTVFFRANSV